MQISIGIWRYPASKKQKGNTKHIALVNKSPSSKKVKEGFERSRKVLAKRADRFSGEGGLSKIIDNSSEKATNMGQYMGLSVIGGSKKKTLTLTKRSSHKYKVHMN